MNFTSNIGSVVKRLERFEAGIPRVLRRATEPRLWEGVLRGVAQRTLREVAAGDPEEHRAQIPGFIQSILSLALEPAGFVISMNKPDPNTETIGQALEVSGGDGRRRLDPSQASILEEAREGVRAWVSTPVEEGGKRRDERDAGLTDGQIADRILQILFHRNRTPERDTATAALTPHIEEFLANRYGQGLPPETVERWLLAVLEAWRKTVLAQLPTLVRQEFRVLVQEIQTTLL